MLLLTFHFELLGRHVGFVLSGRLGSLLGGCGLRCLPLTLKLLNFLLVQAFLLLKLLVVLLLRNSRLLFMFDLLLLHFQPVGLSVGFLVGLDLSGELGIKLGVLALEFSLLLLKFCDFLLCQSRLLC